MYIDISRDQPLRWELWAVAKKNRGFAESISNIACLVLSIHGFVVANHCATIEVRRRFGPKHRRAPPFKRSNAGATLLSLQAGVGWPGVDEGRLRRVHQDAVEESASDL